MPENFEQEAAIDAKPEIGSLPWLEAEVDLLLNTYEDHSDWRISKEVSMGLVHDDPEMAKLYREKEHNKRRAEWFQRILFTANQTFTYFNEKLMSLPTDQQSRPEVVRLHKLNQQTKAFEAVVPYQQDAEGQTIHTEVTDEQVKAGDEFLQFLHNIIQSEAHPEHEEIAA